MSKKIRLTESELIDLIKRVISEQVPNIGGIAASELIASASDIGLSIGENPDFNRTNCEKEFEDYEFVANSFNWCRYNSKADKYSWDGNWAANQVKKDVQTTSSEDLITPALKTISTAKDFCQFVNSYYKFKGDLYNDIDKYVYTYNKWGKIREVIPRDFKITASIPVCKKFKSGPVY
jgi:hypothetical protein